MKYIAVTEFAEKWNIPGTAVHIYCENGKIKGAFATARTWDIQEDFTLNKKENSKKFTKNILVNHLRELNDMRLKACTYHRTQIDLTYKSTRLEGSKLTEGKPALFLKPIRLVSP